MEWTFIAIYNRKGRKKRKEGRKNSEKRQHIKKLVKKRNDRTWRNGNLNRYERMCLPCHANLKNVIASKSNEMYWNFYCVRLLMLWSFVDFYFLFFLVLFLSCDSVRPGPFVIFFCCFLCSLSCLVTFQHNSHSSLLYFRHSVPDGIFFRAFRCSLYFWPCMISHRRIVTIYGFLFRRFCYSLN